jgi:hypothetical protein
MSTTKKPLTSYQKIVRLIIVATVVMLVVHVVDFFTKESKRQTPVLVIDLNQTPTPTPIVPPLDLSFVPSGAVEYSFGDNGMVGKIFIDTSERLNLQPIQNKIGCGGVLQTDSFIVETRDELLMVKASTQQANLLLKGDLLVPTSPIALDNKSYALITNVMMITYNFCGSKLEVEVFFK